jgi:hypothetical protein
VICPWCRGRNSDPVAPGVRVCTSSVVIGMVPYHPYAAGEFPVFSPCGHKFTIAQSEAVESADAKAEARAAAESERRRERQRAATEKHAAEAPRREAIRRKAEAVEKERMACLEVAERRTWLALWLWVALVSAGATVTLHLVAGGSLALAGATIVPCAFALFRLLIVSFDPPVRPAEDLYVTLVWGVMGLTAGFLLHVLARVGS